MAQSRGRRRGSRKIIEADLELMPLMNLFIVLLPMMLMSAVFVEVHTIDMSLPAQAAANDPAEPKVPLELSIHIDGDSYVIEGNGLQTQSVTRDVQHTALSRPGAGSSAQLQSVLQQIVAAHPENHDVRIVAGAKTRYDEIVALMDIARAAGLPQAGLVGAAAGGS